MRLHLIMASEILRSIAKVIYWRLVMEIAFESEWSFICGDERVFTVVCTVRYSVAPCLRMWCEFIMYNKVTIIKSCKISTPVHEMDIKCIHAILYRLFQSLYMYVYCTCTCTRITASVTRTRTCTCTCTRRYMYVHLLLVNCRVPLII